MECLATWKDGSESYLYGHVTASGINAKDDQYRCFVSGTDLQRLNFCTKICRELSVHAYTLTVTYVCTYSHMHVFGHASSTLTSTYHFSCNNIYIYLFISPAYIIKKDTSSKIKFDLIFDYNKFINICMHCGVRNALHYACTQYLFMTITNITQSAILPFQSKTKKKSQFLEHYT